MKALATMRREMEVERKRSMTPCRLIFARRFWTFLLKMIMTKTSTS